jgi:hypothetical protein
MAFTLTFSFEVESDDGKRSTAAGSVKVDRTLDVASLRDAMTHATHDGYRGIAKELLVVEDKVIGKAH